MTEKDNLEDAAAPASQVGRLVIHSFDSFPESVLDSSGLDMWDKIFLITANKNTTCMMCEKPFIFSEEWQHAFQGVFYNGKQLPICRACSKHV